MALGEGVDLLARLRGVFVRRAVHPVLGNPAAS
jgi:hypothetical protein